MLFLFDMNGDNILVFMNDETHFNVDGSVNKQKCRYCTAENPRTTTTAQFFPPPNFSVWCAAANKIIIGPRFFEFEEQRNTVTVNIVSAQWLHETGVAQKGEPSTR